MAKPIKPPPLVIESRENIVQQALGHLAPKLRKMETRAAYGGGLPDVVLCFDTDKEAGDVAKFMFEEMNITNAAGKQKRIALRSDGKWEVLVSDKQMNDMATFSKNKEHGLAAAGGPPGGPPLSPPPSPKAAAAADEPRCNIVTSAANPMSITFACKTPQELKAFTECFPKTVPNYTIEGNALVIRHSEEPGSMLLRKLDSGSVVLDFGGKGSGQDAMLNHMKKLFPETYSKFGSLYFAPGASKNVPYQLTPEAETEAFKRELAFKRLDNTIFTN